MSVADAEHLYFRLRVMDWNREVFLTSRRNNYTYSALAEKWEMHVDLLNDAYYYVDSERMGRISKAVKQYFEPHPQIRDANVQPTAWAGIYTMHARLEMEGGPKDPQLSAQAEKVARQLVAQLPPWIAGLKIGTMSYQWPKTGTSGYLTSASAFLWRRQPEEFRVMGIAHELSTQNVPIQEKSWIQPSWNEGRRATE